MLSAGGGDITEPSPYTGEAPAMDNDSDLDDAEGEDHVVDDLLGDTAGIALAMRLHSQRPPFSSRDFEDQSHTATSALTHENVIQLLKASRVVCAEINPKLTIGYILTEAKKLLHCASCVLYTFDPATSSLVPIRVDDSVSDSTLGCPFRLVKSRRLISTRTESDNCIAAQVYVTGTTIRRCREESILFRLQEESDAEQETQRINEPFSVLTVPVWDTMDKVRAVLEVINKLSSDSSCCAFSEQDELILGHFSLLAGVALRNASLYKEAVASRDLADGLLTLLTSLRPDLGVQSSLLTLTTHAKKIMQVEHCTIYIIDRQSSHLLSMSSDSPNDLKPTRQHFNEEEDDSILGECARKGQPVFLEYEEMVDTSSKRSADESEKTSPPRTWPSSCHSSFTPVTPRLHICKKNVAVVPLRAENQMTIGLIKLSNKRDEEGYLLSFTEEDMRILEMFGRLVGPRLERSDLGMKATSIPPSEAGRASDNINLDRRLDHRSRPSLAAPTIQEEGEEGGSTCDDGFRMHASSVRLARMSLRRMQSDRS